MFDVLIEERRRWWEWRVCDRAGLTMLNGRERTRLEALSQGYGALFRLLSAGYWTS